MEQYFFKITHSYSHKNKLYEALYQRVSFFDHLLIKDAATLEAFKVALQTMCTQLNAAYPRCKPLKIYPTFTGNGLLVEGSWTADFYLVKNSVELKDEFLQYHI